MLFEEFVEQHGVDLLVAHRLRLTLRIADNEFGIYFFYFLGHQPEVRHACRIKGFLVPEADRFEGQNHLAGFVHRLDVLLESRRGGQRAQFPISIDIDRSATRSGCSTDASDKGVGNIAVTYSDGVAFASNAFHSVANIHIFRTGRLIATRFITDGSVPDATRIIKEHSFTNGDVVVAVDVVAEREVSIGCVAAAGRVTKHRASTRGRVAVAGRVAKERLRTSGGVVFSGSVARQRAWTRGRVVVAYGVAKKRTEPGRRVAKGGGVATQRIGANGCVISAGGVE